MKKIAIMLLMSIILVSCSSKKEETQKIEQQAKLEKEKKETEKKSQVLRGCGEIWE